MRIPKAFYGTAGEVSARMRKIAQPLERGAKVVALDFGELVDTQDVRDAEKHARAPGSYPLLLVDQGGFKGKPPHFHCYAFFYSILRRLTARRISDEQFEEAFAWALEEPWRFVGIAGEAGQVFFHKANPAIMPNAPAKVLRGRPEWYQPFLRAALQFWEILEAEGSVFAPGPTPRPFSMACKSVIGVLVGRHLLGYPHEPNPMTTPGRTLELLRIAVKEPGLA